MFIRSPYGQHNFSDDAMNNSKEETKPLYTVKSAHALLTDLENYEQKDNGNIVNGYKGNIYKTLLFPKCVIWPLYNLPWCFRVANSGSPVCLLLKLYMVAKGIRITGDR